MPVVNEPIRAPEFQPGEWLNSPPLKLAELRGKVVLVDFWDYTCTNCLRTLPYLQEWWRRYRDMGLVIVGVHTPEFSFARERANVAAAVQRLGIDYPVLIDNEYLTWVAWANRYWPSKYLVNSNGYMLFFHYGEGEYLNIEANLQILLREIHPGASFPALMVPLRPADEPGAVCYGATPEQYLGFRRSMLGNRQPSRPEQVTAYAEPEEKRQDTVYLSGYWRNGPESITLAAEEGTISIRYRGREVNMVLSPPPEGEGIVLVEQDGDRLPYESLGNDVRPESDGMAVHVDAPRLYCLVRNERYGIHTLRLRVQTPGTCAYAVTFVTECNNGERGEEEAA